MTRFGVTLALLTALAAGAGAQEPWTYDDYAGALLHVNAEGLVNYPALKADSRRLDSFLDRLAALERNAYDQWPEPDKIAFWINAYNAITLKAIVNNYPIQPGGWIASVRFPKNSIRQIDGVWDKRRWTVMGAPMTLDEIEHDTLRKKFAEPRIHMALVCAAMSCPPLRNEPYAGARLQEQFADQTRKFLASSSNFRMDRQGRKVYLSSIFKWFGGDFVVKHGTEAEFRPHSDAERAVLNYLKGFLPEADARWLASTDFGIEYLDYDWSLNAQ